MSNVEKAADIIAKANSAYRERHWLSDIVTYQAALEYAHALADAGLLAADLPAPVAADADPAWAQEYMQYWGWVPDAEWHPTNDFFVNIYGGKISAGFGWADENWDALTPEDLKSIAHALLAAANYVEEQA